MSAVAEHYKTFLARHYSWMTGIPFDEKVAEQKALLAEALGTPDRSQPLRTAVDLGSGPGYQAVALADLGYSPVIATDTNPELLDDLQSHIGARPIRAIEMDLRSIRDVVERERTAAVVCMGDTLTHLPSKRDVQELFASVFEALVPGGRFVITYRDLSAELLGLDRFIAVRDDSSKIMTCFLEYVSADSVMVHDILYVREGQGWKLEKSSCPKLRLSVGWVSNALTEAGLLIRSQGAAGRLSMVVARKP